MNVTLKVGTWLTIPTGQFSLASDQAGILEITGSGGKATVKALKPGAATVYLRLASDLTVSLAVKVVA